MTSAETAPATPRPTIATLGELRASGHEHRPLRTELRDNLLAHLREGRDPWTQSGERPAAPVPGAG